MHEIRASHRVIGHLQNDTEACVKKRTEIIIETERTLIVGQQSPPRSGWCETCGREVELLPPEQAATIARATQRTIYRWVEAAAVHFIEEPDGSLLICCDSLYGRRKSAR
jgi:hypothetical protein